MTFSTQQIIEYRGFDIVHQFDARGPQHEDFYSIVTLDYRGEECDFNSVSDAARWIDDQLELTDEDPNAEHRTW